MRTDSNKELCAHGIGDLLCSRAGCAAPGQPLTLERQEVPALDHRCAERLREWLGRQRKRGVEVKLLGSPAHLERLAA